jgi:glycine/D-amino acid oxidase-like deaminating enzyme
MSQQQRRKKVAVLGAGTVGLSTALKLKERFGHNVEVTVIAAEFLQQTTSYSCGGLWEPYQIAGMTVRIKVICVVRHSKMFILRHIGREDQWLGYARF